MTGYKNKDIVIKFRNVNKKFLLHHQKPTLSENLFLNRKSEEFWALKKASFDICKGESMGIIGPNGSGKTTILEIIAGLTSHTGGKVSISGRVASLLELDAGFHPDLTGAENIYLNAILLGMTRKEVGHRYNEIINFSEIKQFINAPLYTYSAGMVLRLAFSIAVFSDAEIMVIDENVSVGDESFKNKSFKKMQELRRKGVTFVLSSHDMWLIKNLTQKCMIVSGGRVVSVGSTTSIVNRYLRSSYSPLI